MFVAKRLYPRAQITVVGNELDPNFQEKCSHLHNTKSSDCKSLETILEEIEAKGLSSSVILHSKEHQDDILYDFERAKSDIFQWKAHILRSINQDNAKQDALDHEISSIGLVWKTRQQLAHLNSYLT